ncbi:glycosyltransferase [Bifidobacterium breve]|uniref:glycosyltransferase n=1 Tax=Bifidobacterium breve TaxID=1685 RepID=UPI003F6A24F5
MLSVCPSRYEGLGMVAIEAQVAGCPCVLSDQVPHEADISRKTSFISLENKSSWISTVLNISSQTANRQIETSNTCAEKYDISASANRLTFLYVSSAESSNGWEETL